MFVIIKSPLALISPSSILKEPDISKVLPIVNVEPTFAPSRGEASADTPKPGI